METAPATSIEPLGSECLEFTGFAEADAIESL